MKLGPGTAALITGASSGIGRAVALHLAAQGVDLSLVDFAEEGSLGTLSDIQQLGAGGRAIFTRADVADAVQLANAFSRHMAAFRRLDVCVNNAGIGERQWFLDDRSSTGAGKWRAVLDVDLTAVVDGTRLAVQAMQSAKRGGLVLNVASAAGLYPSFNAPVYSAAKGGVVMFSRSLGHLAKSGIRVNALCPEFVETAIVKQGSDRAAKALGRVLQSLGGFIPMQVIIEGVMEFIENDSLAGECMWITNRLGRQWWPTPEEKGRYEVRGTGTLATPDRTADDRRGSVPRTASAQGESPCPGPGAAVRLFRDRLPTPTLPQSFTFSKIIVRRLTSDFRTATEAVRAPLALPLPPTAVLLHVHYAGVNASDVNFSAGRYFGSQEQAAKKLPFDAGFEAVGVVAAIGEGVKDAALAVGSPAAVLQYGCFAEFVQVEAKMAIPLTGPPSPAAVALLTSGLTASIALEQAGHMGSGQTVLVTAAAGGTGQFAVQLAKLAGNTVVATCGSPAKAILLRSLGADTVIDYSRSEVAKELKQQYPGGVDLVYESVGGDMFRTCLNALAVKGRLIIIGMMSQYTAGEGGSWSSWGFPGLCEKLLWKSQAVVGFFLLQYMAHMRRHLARLEELTHSGKLKVTVDPHEFRGLGSVADAVEHLQSGTSLGKVVITMTPDTSSPTLRAAL